MPNNSLMLTRLAGKKVGWLARQVAATIDREAPEPWGSIARGR